MIVACRLAQDRDIKLVHQLASLAGIATTEGREIPKAHACLTPSEPYSPARCNTAATSCGLARNPRAARALISSRSEVMAPRCLAASKTLMERAQRQH